MVLSCSRLLCCGLVEEVIEGVAVIVGTQTRCGGEIADDIADKDSSALGVAVLAVDKPGGGGLVEDGVPKAC